jgi:steroid delta-isomerase-like uncharacterized protein
MAHQTMTAQSRQELIGLNRRFTDMFESGDVSRVDELVAADFVDHNPAPGTTPDRQGLKDWIKDVRAGFSNLRFKVEDEMVEGDKLIVRSKMSGTHSGPYLGMPASNKAFTIDAIDIVRVRDGKAVEHWGVFDALTMLQQLGFAEAPGAPVKAKSR